MTDSLPNLCKECHQYLATLTGKCLKCSNNLYNIGVDITADKLKLSEENYREMRHKLLQMEAHYNVEKRRYQFKLNVYRFLSFVFFIIAFKTLIQLY
jgi:uncharacterized metal-binding protein